MVVVGNMYDDTSRVVSCCSLSEDDEDDNIMFNAVRDGLDDNN